MVAKGAAGCPTDVACVIRFRLGAAANKKAWQLEVVTPMIGSFGIEYFLHFTHRQNGKNGCVDRAVWLHEPQ